MTTERVAFHPVDSLQVPIHRSGYPVLTSEGRDTYVMVQSAERDMEAGKRPRLAIGIVNESDRPVTLSASTIAVEQFAGTEKIGDLKVLGYDALKKEERQRKLVGAILVGVAAGGNAMSAANAGYGHT